MKKVLLFLVLCAMPALGRAQFCPVGSATNAVQNTPTICMPVSAPVGSTIAATFTSPTTQTICDVVADPNNPLTPDPCPTGLYYVFSGVEIVTPGTLLSAVAATINFTTPQRNYPTVGAITSASLVIVPSEPASGLKFFCKAGNTAITITTTASGLFTGSPSYRLIARAIRVPVSSC